MSFFQWMGNLWSLCSGGGDGNFVEESEISVEVKRGIEEESQPMNSSGEEGIRFSESSIDDSTRVAFKSGLGSDDVLPSAVRAKKGGMNTSGEHSVLSDDTSSLALLADDDSLASSTVDGSASTSSTDEVNENSKDALIELDGIEHGKDDERIIDAMVSSMTASDESDDEESSRVVSLMKKALSDMSKGVDVMSVPKLYSSDDFERRGLVGIGFFSKVYLVVEKETQKFYAMKVMNKTKIRKRGAIEDVILERKLLSILDHDFIVRLHSSFQDDDNLYLVMEYIPGGELLTHANDDDAFSEERARFYIAEILVALEYMHDRNIIFRDLKLENVLVGPKGHIKICDFGSAVEMKSTDERFHRVVGSPEYVAPEMLKCSLYGSDAEGYGREIDFWALGVVLYELVFATNPFKSIDDDDEGLYERILSAEIEFPDDGDDEEDEYSNEVKDLVRKLLDRDASERLGGGRSGAREIMGHPFFLGMDWEGVRKGRAVPPFVPELEGEGDTKYVDQESLQEAGEEEEEGEDEDEDEDEVGDLSGDDEFSEDDEMNSDGDREAVDGKGDPFGEFEFARD